MRKTVIKIMMSISLILLCTFVGLLTYAFQLEKQKSHDKRQINSITDPSENNVNHPELDDMESNPNNNNSENKADKNQDSSELPVSEQSTPTPTVTPVPEPIVLAFAGDINFSEGSKPMSRYDSEQKGILGGISEDLVEEMNAADIMMLNNEFPYSTRGSKIPEKSYTFRAHPDRVNILGEMGVDIVSLANNHTLDYGPEALTDTFETLERAGIDYVGAGENLDRAKAPVYYTIGDKTIAYVAASRVVYAMDWYASDSKLGMLGTYDPAIYLESIKEAAANSDFVICYLHWGVEKTNYPVDYQKSLARKYIDAGADFVVGCHPHVLQGFEFYNGKPITYSLGNFWFNSATNKTGLLKLYLDPNEEVRVQILPAMYQNTFTSLINDKKGRKNYFDFMEEISFGVKIDADGFISEAK